MPSLVDRWVAFLSDHRLVRRWIVPVCFMAAVLFALVALVGQRTLEEATEVTAVFLAVSLLVALGGMGIQLAIEAYIAGKR